MGLVEAAAPRPQLATEPMLVWPTGEQAMRDVLYQRLVQPAGAADAE